MLISKLLRASACIGLLAAAALAPGFSAAASKSSSSMELEDALKLNLERETGGIEEASESAGSPAPIGGTTVLDNGEIVIQIMPFCHSQTPSDVTNGIQFGARMAVIQMKSGMRHYGEGSMEIEYKYSLNGEVYTKSVPFTFDTTQNAYLMPYTSILAKPDLKGHGYPTSDELLAGEVTGPTTYQACADANPYKEVIYIRCHYHIDYKGTGNPGTWDGYMFLTGMDTPGDNWMSHGIVDSITEGYIRCDDSSANTPVTASTAQVSCAGAIAAATTRQLGRYDDVDLLTNVGQASLHSTASIKSGALTYIDYTYADYTVDDAGKYIHGSWYTQAGNTVTNTIRIPDAVQIKYDSQGGSTVSPSSKTFAGFEHTVTSEVPTRAGYQFLGWYTAANAGGDKVAAGTKKTLQSDLTLYAAWKANYKVTTEKDGEGTVTDTITGITPGESKTVTWKPAGGWFTESVTVDGKAVTDPDSGSYTFNDIQADHTVAVKFYKGFQVMTQITGGTIDPDITGIKKGSDETVKFAPDAGNYVKSITVDGKMLDTESLKEAIKSGSYSFTGIQEDHEVRVDCQAMPKATVTKKLDDMQYIPEKGSPEFDYRITGTDYLGQDRTFYLHLSVEGQETSASLTIPAGTWKVSELYSDGWKLSAINPEGDSTGAALDTTKGSASCVFLNTPSDYSRFTANSAAVNKLK